MSLERQKLINDLKSYSVKTGEAYVLSSGQTSNIYVDVKQTMLFGPALNNLAKLLHQQAQAFGWYHLVAGVPLGGAHLATMVATYCPPMSIVLIRQEAKDHGTQRRVEAPPGELFKQVVLFEDVITTGKSVLAAAQILEENGFDIRGIVAVVDRRLDKALTLGNYGVRALVDIEELI
jgi:orotate phosphoribosyltransferase